MASKAKVAKGTLVQVGDGATTETFVTIGEVLSFSGVDLESSAIEVTSQDSTVREYISDGLPGSPDITIECNFVASDPGQQLLRDYVTGTDAVNFRVTLSDHASTPSVWTFSGLVLAAKGPSFSTGEAFKASFTVKRTGAVTFTPAP